MNGNRWAEKRVEVARELLEEAGIPAWRLAFRNLAPNMAVDLLEWIEQRERRYSMSNAECNVARITTGRFGKGVA